MRSKSKRRWIWIMVAVVVVGAAGAGGYLLLSDDDDTDSGPIAGPADSGPPEILYVEGNLLKRIGPDESDGEQLAEGISATSISPPGSDSLTWVAFAGPEEPITHLYTRGAEAVETVPGAAPTWKPDGSAFAVLQPVGKNTTCRPDICNGAVEVQEVDPETGERRDLLNKGEYSIHGWIGDDLVVRDLDGSEEALLVTGKNETQSLGVDAKDITSISPDGSYIVTKPAEAPPQLLSVTDGTVSPVGTIGGTDTVLTSVAWNSDSSRIAAIATDLGSTELVVFSPDDLELKPLTELEPSGDVYWSPGGGGVVFTAVNRDEVQLEATYCPLDGSDCTIYITWQTGNRVLGVI